MIRWFDERLLPENLPEIDAPVNMTAPFVTDEILSVAPPPIVSAPFTKTPEEDNTLELKETVPLNVALLENVTELLYETNAPELVYTRSICAAVLLII